MGVGIKTRSFSCYGLREYTDLHEDARVTIEDDSGNDVSTGKLGQGRPVYEPRDLEQGAKAEPQSCVLGFVVEGVPPVGRSWSVRIGRYRFDLPPDRTSNLALSLG